MARPAVFPVPDDDLAIREEASLNRDKTPDERMAVFRDVLELVSATWAGLSEAERLRRLRIGDALDPRPDPWWKHVRRGAIPS